MSRTCFSPKRLPDYALVWQFVDPYAALRAHVQRIVHVHVKDTKIDQARLAREGIDGEGWWRYCIPGSGLLNWATLLAIFQASGYRGCLSIELEDEVWEHSEGQILQALLLSQRLLDQLLGPVVEVPPVEATPPPIPQRITFV